MRVLLNVPGETMTLRASWDILYDGNNQAVAVFHHEKARGAAEHLAKVRGCLLSPHEPAMLELIQALADTWTNDCQFIPCETEAASELGSKLSRLAAQATQLLAKIEGGQSGR